VSLNKLQTNKIRGEDYVYGSKDDKMNRQAVEDSPNIRKLLSVGQDVTAVMIWQTGTSVLEDCVAAIIRVLKHLGNWFFHNIGIYRIYHTVRSHNIKQELIRFSEKAISCNCVHLYL
jgi:hypothetical protein